MANISQRTAVLCAQITMDEFLRTGAKQHGLTHRYRDGRWDVYSVDIGSWHILLNDNAGKIVHCEDCSRVTG
jgi:hypothetical protein